MSNESARLNLGVLIEWDRLRPGSARDALMNLPEMSQSIADAILDWIDPDSDPRGSGAEASYYSGLGLPYGPRNAEPTSLEELLLVRDVTRQHLFGADENFNYRIDAGEQAGGGRTLSAAGAMPAPWAMLLTVFSAEKNARPDASENRSEQRPRSLRQARRGDHSDLAVIILLSGPARRRDGQRRVVCGQLDLAVPALPVLAPRRVGDRRRSSGQQELPADSP